VLLNVRIFPVCQVGVATVVTELDAADCGLFPLAFSALTVNVYAVAGVNPVIIMGEVEPVAVTPPGEDVTVNEVAVPPVIAGVKATDADATPAVAVPIVGASGKSIIFVVPAEASLNLDPAKPEALAFVTATKLLLYF
jgi:hypothetical protein